MKLAKAGRRLCAALLFAALTAGTVPMRAAAQAPVETKTVAAPLDQRANELIAIISDKQPLESYFDPTFLKAVPPAQFRELSADFIKRYGQPKQIVSTTRKGETAATLKLAFEKAIVNVEIAISSEASHLVTGLFFTDVAVPNDSIEAIAAELAALPGKTAFKIEHIATDGTHSEIAGSNVTQQFAIGSTFKLYILAELAAQIEAGKRKWTDIIPLRRRSLSSFASDGIPLETPVTLQLLATWMIGVSDNAATDELLLLLGRDKVEARVKAIGHDDISRVLPFLTTVEAFLIKGNHDNALAAYIKGSDTEQRALLARSISNTGYEEIDEALLIGKPTEIDTVEWFASPNDIVRLMDYIRTRSNPVMFSIMAQSVAPFTAKKWKYLGFKGGSEPGVISLSYLGQKRSGEWIIITGSWNNVDAVVDHPTFIMLMQRLLELHAG
jgi:beta-lactamase class A